MGSVNNKSNKIDNKETSDIDNKNISDNSKYDYNFGDIIFIPLILDQIFQFIDDNDKNNLYFCNKKSYQLYCDQITKLKINKKVKKSEIVKVLNKYKNIEYLEILDCNDISFFDENNNIKNLNLTGNSSCNLNIKDFSPLFKLNKLEILDITFANISNFSFLKNIKNLKELHLNLLCEKRIKDSNPISYLEKLEILTIGNTKIENISFLEKNKQIKKLKLSVSIKDYTPISYLEKLEILHLEREYHAPILTNISFLEKNQNIKNLCINDYRYIEDYTPISKLDKLEI